MLLPAFTRILNFPYLWERRNVRDSTEEHEDFMRQQGQKVRQAKSRMQASAAASSASLAVKDEGSDENTQI